MFFLLGLLILPILTSTATDFTVTTPTPKNPKNNTTNPTTTISITHTLSDTQTILNGVFTPIGSLTLHDDSIEILSVTVIDGEGGEEGGDLNVVENTNSMT